MSYSSTYLKGLNTIILFWKCIYTKKGAIRWTGDFWFPVMAFQKLYVYTKLSARLRYPYCFWILRVYKLILSVFSFLFLAFFFWTISFVLMELQMLGDSKFCRTCLCRYAENNRRHTYFPFVVAREKRFTLCLQEITCPLMFFLAWNIVLLRWLRID